MRGLIFLALGALVGTAYAHPLAPALLDLREDGEGRVAVLWRTAQLAVPGAPPMRPLLPAACTEDTPPQASVAAGVNTMQWVIRCPHGLVGETLSVDSLGPARTQALLRVRLADGRLIQHVLRADAPALVVPPRPEPLAVLRDYGRLGVEHIATGTDHLLFVFGLFMLASTPGALLRTVTAFTLGHSITLALTALGLLAIPSRAAELAIALTVLALAVELARSSRETSRLWRAPWRMALAFGLLHGLGFAGALREIGLPDGEIPLALLSFNLGIETGQLAFVAAVALVATLAGRIAPAPGWLRLVPVYTMGSLAAFWCFERTAALIH